jgi:hypothetical protein
LSGQITKNFARQGALSSAFREKDHAPLDFRLLTAFFEVLGEDVERLGVGAGYMFLLVGNTGFLIESAPSLLRVIFQVHAKTWRERKKV